MNKMKLRHVISALCLIGAPVFASGIEVKAGMSTVKAANDKGAFDAGIGYAIQLERFFAIVPEVNFQWIKYDKCATEPCQTVTQGALTSTLTTTNNHYTIPLMLNGRLYIPMGGDEVPAIQPYLTVGLGYAWSMYEGSTPAYSSNGVSVAASSTSTTLSGLMYQAMLGFQFNLGMMTEGSASATNLILEAGYRGGQVEKSGFKTDMSGAVVRAGVAFRF